MMEGLLEGGDEKRVDACGRKGGVAGKLVADVTREPRSGSRPITQGGLTKGSVRLTQRYALSSC